MTAVLPARTYSTSTNSDTLYQELSHLHEELSYFDDELSDDFYFQTDLTFAPDFNLDFGPRVTLDLRKRLVKADGRNHKLAYKEFELLRHLANNEGTVVSREQLFASVWGDEDLTKNSRTIDVHIRRLREKLGLEDNIITVRGRGYRFESTSVVEVLS